MPTITVSSPEKLIVSDNGIAHNQPSEPTTESDSFLKANATLAVWLVFLAIGGGILALYYARIGYLPDIEWKSALIYLFVGSFVGGMLGLLLTLSLFFPGFIWSVFIVFDPGVDFSYATPVHDLSEKEAPRTMCTLSTIRELGLPFLGILLISHLLLPVDKRLYWVFALGLLVIMFRAMRKRFRNLIIEKRKAQKRQRQDISIAKRQLFNYSSWFTLSLLLNQISMYVIYWLYDRPADLSRLNVSTGEFPYGELTTFIALTLICTAGSWISTHAVAALYRYHQRQAIIASLVAAGLLIFTADYFSLLSMKLMNRYGMGYYQRFDLLVTKDSYENLKRHGVQPCGAEPQICNVEILSKVGDQYFLRVGDTVYVMVKKSEVVSISQRNHP